MGDALDFIEPDAKSYKPKHKIGIERVGKLKKQTKDKAIKMDTNQFKKAKSAHNAEIAKLKQSIKRHKLLIKQAKIMYKLNQMKGDK